MRGFGVGGGLALRRFGVILRNGVYFEPCVYPPPRVVCDFVENPYMIFDVYITIISGRNKYRKISEWILIGEFIGTTSLGNILFVLSSGLQQPIEDY